MARKKPLPWRIQTDDETGFDELVVGIGGNPCLIHAEMMDERSIFVSIGDLCVWAHVDKHGRAKVTHTEECEPLKTKRARHASTQRQGVGKP